MKKLLFFLVATMLLGVSCQQQNEFGELNNGDAVTVQLNMGIPELATRSGETNMNSGLGAIDNFSENEWAEYDLRYILEVYDTDKSLTEPIKAREVKTYDKYQETTFEVRLIPNRNYRFVVWADFVKQGSEDDLNYNTTDLNNITRNSIIAMDECHDAYFIKEDISIKDTGLNKSLVLKRPFGKIRVITTDFNEVNYGSEPSHVMVKFHDHELFDSLNAVTGKAEGKRFNEYEYDITKSKSAYTKGYDGDEANMTLFADYILAGDMGAQEVNFEITVWGEDGREINSHDFNTQIPLERNHLTTIVGNLLTLQNKIEISIDDDFDGEYIRNWEDESTPLASWDAGVLNANGNYTFELNDGANDFTLIVPQSAINQITGKLSPVGAAEFVASEDDLTANTFTIEGLMVEPTRAAAAATVTSGTMKVANWEDGVHVQFDLWYTFDDAEAEYTEYQNIRFDFKGDVMAKTTLAQPAITANVDVKNITLTWEAVEGAGSYSITNGDNTEVITNTEYTFEGEYGTTYTFTVVAIPANEDDYYPSNPVDVVVTTVGLTYKEIEIESTMTRTYAYQHYIHFYGKNAITTREEIICNFVPGTDPAIFVEGRYTLSGTGRVDFGISVEGSKYNFPIEEEGKNQSAGRFESITVVVTKVSDYTFDIEGTFTLQQVPATVYTFKTRYTTPKLDTPSNVKAEVVKYKDVEVTWDSVVRATGYRVSVNGGEAITVTDSEYRFTGTYNSEYSISVVAFSESNPDSKAANVTVKTEAAPCIYLKPNSNWKSDGARFAAYFWGAAVGEKWVSMTAVGDGIYEAHLPEGYDYGCNVIFCRMIPATENNWNNRWNQTGNLTVPTDGKNLYTVEENTWDNVGGTWSVK